MDALAAAHDAAVHYLDLGKRPVVRWTSFNSKTDSYQGELINKTRYMRDFLRQRGRVEGYELQPDRDPLGYDHRQLHPDARSALAWSAARSPG
jgi:hypothetical protein